MAQIRMIYISWQNFENEKDETRGTRSRPRRKVQLVRKERKGEGGKLSFKLKGGRLGPTCEIAAVKERIRLS